MITSISSGSLVGFISREKRPDFNQKHGIRANNSNRQLPGK